MKLLTKEQSDKLIDNGRRQQPVKGTEGEIDFWPVVKLFHAAGGATWLLTEIDPDSRDIAWGLCDLGMGLPEYGTVGMSELANLRGPFGLPVERDLHWEANGPISAYIAAAIAAGRIVELPADGAASA
jgi:DUF2958 family protein